MGIHVTAERKVSFLMDDDSPTQPALMCRINMISLLILKCLRQPNKDWLSTPDTGASEVKVAAEVKQDTIKAVIGQH